MSKVYNHHSLIQTNNLEIGESIEEKMRRITENNEKITDSVTPIYTERKDGVLPQYDIRTDRFEIALEAMDKVTASNIAKRDAAANAEQQQNKED